MLLIKRLLLLIGLLAVIANRCEQLMSLVFSWQWLVMVTIAAF
jgi:hypothetical protein